jgi:hypothetical protein
MGTENCAPAHRPTATPSAAQTISASGTELCEAVTLGRNLIYVAVKNTGATNALTGCKIKQKANANDVWHDYFGDADFDSTTNTNLEFGSTTKPHTLAAAGSSDFKVWVQGAYAVRVVLTSTGGTTATAMGSLSRG